MKIRACFCAGLLLAAPVTWACSGFHTGSSLTLGSVAENGMARLRSDNPATSQLTDRRFSMASWSTLSMGYEIGQMNELFKNMDRLIDLLTQEQTISPTEITTYIRRLNRLIQLAGDQGKAKAFLCSHIPLFPISLQVNKHSITIDTDLQSAAYIDFIGDTVNPLQDTRFENGRLSIDNDSVIAVQSAFMSRFSVGWSSPLSALPGLSAGLRLNVFNTGLKRDLALLDPDTNTSNLLFDQLQQTPKRDSGIGVDGGVMWDQEYYRVELSWLNINQPRFRYNTLPLQDLDLDNDIVSQIQTTQSYTMASQWRLHSLWKISPWWFAHFNADLNAVDDSFGNPYQWISLSTQYRFSNRWLPTLRSGWRTNTGGDTISYLTLGTTLFSALNIDFAYGLNKVKVDSDRFPRSGSLPQSMVMSIGFEAIF